MINYIKSLFAIKVKSQQDFFKALWKAEKRKILPKIVDIRDIIIIKPETDCLIPETVTIKNSSYIVWGSR